MLPRSFWGPVSCGVGGGIVVELRDISVRFVIFVSETLFPFRFCFLHSMDGGMQYGVFLRMVGVSRHIYHGSFWGLVSQSYGHGIWHQALGAGFSSLLMFLERYGDIIAFQITSLCLVVCDVCLLSDCYSGSIYIGGSCKWSVWKIC